MVLILFLSVKATYLVVVGQGIGSSPPGARQQRFEHRGPPGPVCSRAKSSLGQAEKVTGEKRQNRSLEQQLGNTSDSSNAAVTLLALARRGS